MDEEEKDIKKGLKIKKKEENTQKGRWEEAQEKNKK